MHRGLCRLSTSDRPGAAMTAGNHAARPAGPIETVSRHADPFAGSLAFRRGWIASQAPFRHDITDEWDEFFTGPWILRVHPALAYASATDGHTHVAVLGDAINIDAPEMTAVAIARNVLGEHRRSQVHAVRYIAELGGRFTIVVQDPRGTIVVPDCAGTLPIYWARPSSPVIGSYVHLLGEVIDAPPDDVGRSFLQVAREMQTPGTLYVPGVRTPFLGIRPVLPNHLLSITDRVSHRRFYPFDDTRLENNLDRSYERFRESFASHAAAIARSGRIGLSLTGGLDSRSALAATRGALGPGAMAWTYLFTEHPPDAMLHDAIEANHLALAVGISHKLIPLRMSDDAEFTAAYHRTFTHTAQFPRVPHSYHDQLPVDLVQMQCMVAEVGTGFYKRREGSPTVDRLAELYCRHAFGRTPDVLDAWAEYLEYAPLPDDTPVDFHDLFYWETRIGRWGALRIQEIDLAHRIVSPFNARRIVEALQGPPLDQRSSKQALQRLIREIAPDLPSSAGR